MPFTCQSSSHAPHPEPFLAVRQHPQVTPQYPKCFVCDQYKYLLPISHCSQYQLYQYGLHSEHSQIVSRLWAPKKRTISSSVSYGSCAQGNHAKVLSEVHFAALLTKLRNKVAGCSAVLCLSFFHKGCLKILSIFAHQQLSL